MTGLGPNIRAIGDEPPGLGDPLLAAAFEHAPYAALLVDAQGRVLRANARAAELAGAPGSAAPGAPLHEVVPGIAEADLARVLAAEEQSDVVVDRGSAHPLLLTASPLSPAEGGPAVLCVLGDATDPAARQARWTGIQRLASELSGAATPDAVTELIVSHARELVGADSVAAAMRVPDAAALAMVGMAGFGGQIERDWQRFGLEPRTPMGDAATSGAPVFLESAADTAREYPHLANISGRAIAAVPVRGHGDAIGALAFRFAGPRRLDAEDRALMLTIGEHYGQALDRARLFEAAESERQRLAALMHQLPVGVAIAEAGTGHIVAVNAKATEIWRVPPPGGVITDVTGYVAFHPDGRRYTTDDWPIARSLAHGEVVENEEVEAELGDGSRGWVSISSRPVRDPAGRVLGAVTTLVDVTDRRRRETQARFVADAIDLLAESLDPDETLRRLAALVVPRLADWCAVYVRERDRIRTVAVAHSDPAKVALAWEFNDRYPTDPEAEGGVAGVLRTGAPQLTPRITREMVEAAAPDPDFVRVVYDELGLRSVLTVALRARGELIGALTLVMAESGRTVDARDLAFAEELATHAALAVANARLYTAQQEVAETLQRSLLPLRLPDIPGLEVAARYRPAGERATVGGDFYDLWEITGDEFGIAIGDVCGKGAAAAALTALARHTVRTASLTLIEHRPADVMLAVNDAIIKRAGRGRFCTIAHGYGRRTPEGFEVTLACGGHPLPFVVRRDGSAEQPGRPGTLLGVFEDLDVQEHRVRLAAGDTLVLWTDGVVERRHAGELFGEDRLRDLLAATAGQPPDAVADAIEQAVLAFSPERPQDDLALIVARVEPAADGPA